ncbi:unnamed protein product [Bursaphelenchus okinawaensis]|uniref:Uncharacterized protein n=1 Tax=Bursaphelenchus okinawaensis TaxID=465554 RepID=A0A811LQI2_9BILA|nr:unnamed protein product [Bursaphelenchus okinawaensis]CAG9127160.1 unnamed protein product [Bursaphelenchus okinawaensis]
MTDLAATYRESSPITGYMGHKPGEKFLVGQRYHNVLNGTFAERSAPSPRTLLENAEPTEALTGAASVNYQFDSDGNPVFTEGRQSRNSRNSRGSRRSQKSQRSQRNAETSQSQLMQQQQYLQPVNGLKASMGPVFQIPVQFVPALDASSASLQIPVHPSLLNVSQNQPPSRSRSVHDVAGGTERLSIHDEDNRTERRTSRSRRSGTAGSKTARSKRARSEPKTQRDTRRGAASLNIPNDYGPLNGAGSGWWSEGQALRNIRRHRERNNIPNTGEAPRETIEQSEVNQGYYGNGTPAPGYTGHMMDLPHLGIGKNFSDTAKDSRKLQQSLRDTFTQSFEIPRTQRTQRSNRSQRSQRSNRSKTPKSQR